MKYLSATTFVLFLLGCQACGSSAAGVDANPCPLEVAPPWPTPTESATIVFDREITLEPIFGYGFPMNVAIFPKANGNLALFTWWIYFELDRDGTVLARVPYADPGGGTMARAYSVAAGATNTAVALASGARTFACVVRADGAVDTASCHILYEVDSKLVPLSWTGQEFVALTRLRPDSIVHAHVFDESMQLVRENDLWTSTDPYLGLGGQSGLASLGNLNVVCSQAAHNDRDGGSNRCTTDFAVTFPSSLDPAQVRHTDLLPLEVQGGLCRAVASPDRVALFHHARCYWANPGGLCQDYPATDPTYDRRAWYLTLLDPTGTPVLLRKSIGVNGTPGTFWDGERFVLIWGDIHDTRAWAFDSDGNTLLENVDIALQPAAGENELLSEPVVATLGPNDYILVYGMSPGDRTGFARFSLPAPPAQKPKP